MAIPRDIVPPRTGCMSPSREHVASRVIAALRAIGIEYHGDEIPGFVRDTVDSLPHGFIVILRDIYDQDGLADQFRKYIDVVGGVRQQIMDLGDDVAVKDRDGTTAARRPIRPSDVIPWAPDCVSRDALCVKIYGALQVHATAYLRQRDESKIRSRIRIVLDLLPNDDVGNLSHLYDRGEYGKFVATFLGLMRRRGLGNLDGTPGAPSETM